MVKVKITRDCHISGKHYSEGEIAEVSEKDEFILYGIGRAVAAGPGNVEPKPKEVKKSMFAKAKK